MIRNYGSADRAQVVSLWNAVFPNSTGHNAPNSSIDRKVAVDDGLFFVAEEGNTIVGTVMAGYDGHRGWLYKLAVHPRARGCGIARALIRTAETALADLGCAKVNLQVRDTNHDAAAFWAHMGYAVEPRISMGRQL